MSINTRDKLVRDLNATEAGRLLVHGHTITKERRDALLFRRGPIEAYFSAEEAKAIRQWIETEDYLPQDYRIDGSLDCHPKRPTHWCDKHGHVVACDCDKRRSKRDERASEDWQAPKRCCPLPNPPPFRWRGFPFLGRRFHSDSANSDQMPPFLPFDTARVTTFV